MKRILGLDLGTASIGWAVVNQATTDEEQAKHHQSWRESKPSYR